MKIGFFIARILMVSLFFFSLYGKVFDFQAQVELTANKGVPFATLAILGAIFCEIVGGILLLIGKRGASFGAFLLLGFMIVITPIFFPFWQNPNLTNNFMLNVAISGGLLFMMMYYFEEDRRYIKKIYKKLKN